MLVPPSRARIFKPSNAGPAPSCLVATLHATYSGPGPITRQGRWGHHGGTEGTEQTIAGPEADPASIREWSLLHNPWLLRGFRVSQVTPPVVMAGSSL
jgi:hypothetical protein